jgi:hypothetical protein
VYLGIGDPGAGVGITDCTGIAHRGPRGLMAAIARSMAGLRFITSENCTPWRRRARTTVRLP